MGGSTAEPVVIEMSDEAAGLLVRAIGLSLDAEGAFTADERRALIQAQAALREMSL